MSCLGQVVVGSVLGLLTPGKLKSGFALFWGREHEDTNGERPGGRGGNTPSELKATRK